MIPRKAVWEEDAISEQPPPRCCFLCSLFSWDFASPGNSKNIFLEKLLETTFFMGEDVDVVESRKHARAEKMNKLITRGFLLWRTKKACLSK
jgi:hypothetical protein